MISKITRILLITLIVGIALAVVYLNPNETTLFYGPQQSVTLMGGVIFLGCFALGLLCSLYLWVVYGIKVFIRERSFRAQEDKQQQFYKLFLKARSLQSSGELMKAAELWQKLIKKDPTDIIARVELSHVLTENGDYLEALKVLDKAREADSTNAEVLLQAARLNELLGNSTAALDNLALSLYQEPTTFAASKARSLSLKLGRVQDAIEYETQFSQLGGDTSKEQSTELHFFALREEFADKRKAEELSEQDLERIHQEEIAAIKKFSKHNPSFMSAIDHLVRYHESRGETEEAAENLIRAAKANNSPELWKRAIDLWLTRNNGERALSAARTALRNASRKEERFSAHLDIARVYLLTEKAEEALSELKEVAELEHSESEELRRQYLALSGYAFNKLERFRDAAKVWKRMLETKGGIGPVALLPLSSTDSSDGSKVYFPALADEKA